VEQWTVENQAQENHEFHLHQVHFLVQSQNNFAINNGAPLAPGITGQYLDMVEVPAWDGNPAHPFPSVTLLVDFRGPDIGSFVFHCHILGHEDLGMMNIIQVVPATATWNKAQPTPAAVAESGTPVPARAPASNTMTMPMPAETAKPGAGGGQE